MNKEKFQELYTIISRVAEERGAVKTFCPSEIARIYNPGSWRKCMEDVREVAHQMILEGKIMCTQKGEIADIKTVKGPIRLRKL